MFSSALLRWRNVSIALHCLHLLSFSADARPFVLLSGWDSLPDDDLSPSSPADIEEPVHASVGPASLRAGGHAPLYVVPNPTNARAPLLSALAGARRFRALHRSGKPVLQTVAKLDRFGNSVPAAQSLGCYDLRRDVVIESGLQGHADVFSEGHATSLWATSSMSKLMMPSTEKNVVFVVKTGQAVSLAHPEVGVSDSSILTVELQEKKSHKNVLAGTDPQPTLFVSKHICKKAGIATVTIALPLQRVAASSLCPGSPPPVVFSYQKACAPTSHALDIFKRAASAQLPEEAKAVALHSKATPWEGIIPSGGVRAFVAVVIALAIAIIIYEYGTYWMSNKIRAMILEMGPVMFGCEASIEHVSLSFWFGHMTYTIQGLYFANPAGVVCSKPYFMKVDEIKLFFNVFKFLKTCGGEIEIRQLVARHIQANVEVDGYVYGVSNISKVMTQMETRNKAWVAELAQISDTHGIDAAAHFASFEKWMKGVAERVTLTEVFMEGIAYSLSNKALGMEVAIADMEFHDFSAQHNAVGMTAISYYLIHAVLEGMAEDIGGVKMGHERFEGLVNSIKGWTT